MNIIVSDALGAITHANQCKAYIEALCPTAIVTVRQESLSASVTQAINTYVDIICRPTTGLSDARNLAEGDTAWDGLEIESVYGAGVYGYAKYGESYTQKVGIVHALGSNSTPGVRDLDPSMLDIILACGSDTDDTTGSYGPGLDLCHYTETTQSYATAKICGIIAQLMVDNPTWNFHDARQALRQTASNWSTGWIELTGFGEVDKAAADAVTSLTIDSPTRKTITSTAGQIVFTWVNSKLTAFSTTVIAMYNSKPYRGQKPITSEIIYDGALKTYTYTHALNTTKYFAFYSKDSSGNYSMLEDNIQPDYNFDIYQTALTATPVFENKIFKAIYEIKNALEALSEFKFVGEYPSDVSRAITSGNSPCLLVQEGDEDLSEYQFNLTNDKTFVLSVWMYNDNEKSRIETLSDLQLLIEQTMLSDALRTASQAYCIEWDSAEKGGYLDGFDGYSVGYSNSKSLRKINFNVAIQITR